MTTKKADPGSISTGTLRTNDLLGAFLEALRNLDEDEAIKIEDGLKQGLLDAVLADASVDEVMVDFVDQLTDALNDRAPFGHHFGAHEGDGADFGFWPNDPDPDPNPDKENDDEDLARDYEGYSRD